MKAHKMYLARVRKMNDLFQTVDMHTGMQQRRLIGAYSSVQTADLVMDESDAWQQRSVALYTATAFCMLVALAILGLYKFLETDFAVENRSSPVVLPVVTRLQSQPGSTVRVTKKFEFIRDTIRKINPKVEADGMARAIVRESALAGYDPFLITSVIFSESTFRTHVVSNKGAVGLMQLLPTTAEYIAEKQSIHWKGSQSLYAADYNIKLGITYIDYLVQQFDGDVRLALMAYNWGPGNVRKALRGQRSVLPQVRQYASKIMKRQAELRSSFLQNHPSEVA